jgi:hypothetical protein
MILNRRHRHFNPASAGAVLALDARTLTLADGDPVSSWTAKGGTSPTGSGSTRPIFKTNIVNGQPVVRFDGVDDGLVGPSISGSASNYSVFVVRKSNTFPEGSFWLISQSSFNLILGNNYSGSYYNASGWVGSGVNATSFRVESWVFADPAATIYVSGADSGLGGSYTAVSLGVAEFGSGIGFPSYHYDGDIAALIIFASAASAALRRRIEQSLAFSFRISCA